MDVQQRHCMAEMTDELPAAEMLAMLIDCYTALTAAAVAAITINNKTVLQKTIGVLYLQPSLTTYIVWLKVSKIAAKCDASYK